MESHVSFTDVYKAIQWKHKTGHDIYKDIEFGTWKSVKKFSGGDWVYYQNLAVNMPSNTVGLQLTSDDKAHVVAQFVADRKNKITPMLHTCGAVNCL